jgi:hypothetical protein
MPFLARDERVEEDGKRRGEADAPNTHLPVFLRAREIVNTKLISGSPELI